MLLYVNDVFVPLRSIVVVVTARRRSPRRAAFSHAHRAHARALERRTPVAGRRGVAEASRRRSIAAPMATMVLRADDRCGDKLTSATSSSASYGTDIERGSMDDAWASTPGAAGAGRRRGWGRVTVATLATLAALGVASLAAVRGGDLRRFHFAALGVQPDARGVAPPESEGFVRRARRNYGAALMRASYHQTREVGDADTTEEADALADRDALADIVDEEFYDDGDGGGRRGGEHPAELGDGEASAETRERSAATSELGSEIDSSSSSSRRDAAKSASSGGHFLSRGSREEALKNQRRRMRREAREARRSVDVDDEDGRVDANVPSEDGDGDEDDDEEDQKYYKSINGGWFHVNKSAKKDADAADVGDGDEEDGVVSLHNSYGEIPGLLDHLKANGAQVGQMRVVTYANSAYWPVAKILIDSARRNAPGVVDALTVMVTDRATLKECVETGVMCFLDTDMIDVLGDNMNTDGSISAGRDDANGDLGKALRIVWTWRKVHVVYTLVQAGYGCLFLDASTVLLNDPRELVRAKLDAGALLVTLSDFGGKLEQKAINTGLIAARPNEYIGKLLEDWMKLEPDATDTEQAALTWNIAPNARADGVIITALSQAVAPSYLTFDVNAHMNRDSGQFSGYLVHAAYCGSVKGKIAFLSRVDRLSQDSTTILPVSADEERGCDVFDRHKFFSCGLAPWDGICM